MSTTSKQRLDLMLVEMGLAASREKAKRIILSGIVRVDGQRVDKSGTFVSPEAKIFVEEDPVPFVSRGGLKLQKALETFKPPVKDRIYIDVGASTGGFTDCLLKFGAKKVYSIDVGYGQLAWKLRQDHRVVVMERTNIRDVTGKDLEDTPQGAVVDVAFISLRIVLPVINEILLPDSHIISLIKPQFEAGREKVGRKGVIRSPEVHREVLNNVLSTANQLDLTLKGLTFSPIKGPKGNIEFLLHLYKGHIGDERPLVDTVEHIRLIESVVKTAHGQL
ncbi:MAG TPA: TlyA family RNA methyltransferase [Clostridia bacterium]|nr:TlyA family RNA methyltransferase [Clostridia bacterium]